MSCFERLWWDLQSLRLSEQEGRRAESVRLVGYTDFDMSWFITGRTHEILLFYYCSMGHSTSFLNSINNCVDYMS